MENTMNLLTIDEARKILRVGRNTMYSLVEEGIPNIKLGKQIRIPHESLIEWINNNLRNNHSN